MKFGTEVRKQQFNVKDLTDYSGYFDFDPAQTSLPNATQTTGDGYASFLLGAVNTSTLNYSGNSSAHRFAAMSFYAQDDWKVSSRLTLNLGLRYDRFWPMSDATGRLSSFDPTEPNPGAGGILGALAFVGNGPGRTGQSSFQKIYNKAFGAARGISVFLRRAHRVSRRLRNLLPGVKGTRLGWSERRLLHQAPPFHPPMDFRPPFN